MVRPPPHAEAGFILRHTAQHQGLVTTGWKLLCVLASLSVGEQAGGRTAFPPHQCRKPRPCRRGCWKKRRLRLARAARPSALIPDTLMGRWRRWAGAAKKIIRSFELRLLASLSATMNPEMISMIVTMNGRWSRGQSRSAQLGEFDARAAGGGEQQQRVVILTTGGDPGACVRLSVRFCEPLWSRAAVRRGAERRGRPG